MDLVRCTFIALLGWFLFSVGELHGQGVSIPTDQEPEHDNTFCLECHSDPQLLSETGQSLFVDVRVLVGSEHKTIACFSCHNQPGAQFEDLPHFSKYQPVNCESCHRREGMVWMEYFYKMLEPFIIEIPTQEQPGPPNWIPAAVGLLGSIAAVVLAVAIWQMSQAVSIAILAVGMGAGTRQTFIGVAYWRAAELAGRARVIEAEGQARAQIMSAEAAGIAEIRRARLGEGR
ncbi:MAG: cytochrome c3 family protein [bacterium]